MQGFKLWTNTAAIAWLWRTQKLCDAAAKIGVADHNLKSWSWVRSLVLMQKYVCTCALLRLFRWVVEGNIHICTIEKLWLLETLKYVSFLKLISLSRAWTLNMYLAGEKKWQSKESIPCKTQVVLSSDCKLTLFMENNHF